MKIDRQEFLQEMKLRRFVRKAIKIAAKKRQIKESDALKEEQKLRGIIRNLLNEKSGVDSDTDPAPYRSTAMNLLADVLNVLLPIVKPNYRKLASEENYVDQRKSFRDNVLSAVDSFFDTLRGMSGGEAGTEDPISLNLSEIMTLAEVDINVDVDTEENPNMIVPDKEKPEKKSKEEEEEEDFQTFSIKGSEGTGARMAFNSLNNSNFFDEIQKTYKILDNQKDKQEFESYLIHNLDLWFVKYEKEVSEELGQEPAFTEPITQMPQGGQMTQGVEADSAPGLP
jgi:hypothetical protein